jgi:hypothetical protein
MRSTRHLRIFSRAAIAVATFAAVTSGLPAQARPATRLAPPDVSLDEEFSVVASVRELTDGRVLVTDEREGRVVVVDLRTGDAVQIGRTGAGPGEYRQVGRLWPLAADSSILKEPFSPRWLILSAAQVVTTVGPSDSSVRTVGPNRLMGTDGQGNVFWTQFARDAAGRPSLSDSLLLLRLNRGTQRVDTIARVQSENGWSTAAGVSASAPAVAASAGGAPQRRTYRIALTAPDQVAVFPDGWIAIARANPYRVDWCPPDRACRRGQAMGTESLPMTDREKRAYLAVAAATQTWPPTTDPAATAGWPTVVPPFATPTSRIDGSALVPLVDGRLLIERLPTAAVPVRRYDVISRSGALLSQLDLELVERIVGAGSRHLYVAVTDADGIQRLRRHPFP